MNQWIDQSGMSPAALVGGLLVALAIVLLIVVWRWRRKDRDLRQLQRLLKPYVLDSRESVFVPDEVDGQVWLDRLLLTQGGILVLDVRRYEGNLFGGEQINEWTQLLGMKRSTFRNPLLSMPTRVQAVKSLVPDIPVIGRVVFTCLGRFHKGMPRDVSTCDTLANDLGAFFASRVDADRLHQAWQHLAQHLQPADQAGLNEAI